MRVSFDIEESDIQSLCRANLGRELTPSEMNRLQCWLEEQRSNRFLDLVLGMIREMLDTPLEEEGEEKPHQGGSSVWLWVCRTITSDPLLTCFQAVRQAIAADHAEAEGLSVEYYSSEDSTDCGIAGTSEQIRRLLDRLHRLGLSGFVVDVTTDKDKDTFRDHPAVAAIVQI